MLRKIAIAAVAASALGLAASSAAPVTGAVHAGQGQHTTALHYHSDPVGKLHYHT